MNGLQESTITVFSVHHMLSTKLSPSFPCSITRNPPQNLEGPVATSMLSMKRVISGEVKQSISPDLRVSKWQSLGSKAGQLV